MTLYPQRTGPKLTTVRSWIKESPTFFSWGCVGASVASLKLYSSRKTVEHLKGRWRIVEKQLGFPPFSVRVHSLMLFSRQLHLGGLNFKAVDWTPLLLLWEIRDLERPPHWVSLPPSQNQAVICPSVQVWCYLQEASLSCCVINLELPL